MFLCFFGILRSSLGKPERRTGFCIEGLDIHLGLRIGCFSKFFDESFLNRVVILMLVNLLQMLGLKNRKGLSNTSADEIDSKVSQLQNAAACFGGLLRHLLAVEPPSSVVADKLLNVLRKLLHVRDNRNSEFCISLLHS